MKSFLCILLTSLLFSNFSFAKITITKKELQEIIQLGTYSSKYIERQKELQEFIFNKKDLLSKQEQLDIEQGLKRARATAEEGNLNQQKALFGMNWLGITVPQNSERAAYWLIRAAEQGDKNSLDAINIFKICKKPWLMKKPCPEMK